jgi:hypothetical protein
MPSQTEFAEPSPMIKRWSSFSATNLPRVWRSSLRGETLNVYSGRERVR